MDLLVPVLAIVGLIAALAVLAAGIWLQLAEGDEVAEHWPMLDEDPTLNVTNGIGDSRPLGVWTALDPVTPEQMEEDRPYLARGPSPYADNMVLPSGRSWHFDRMGDSRPIR